MLYEVLARGTYFGQLFVNRWNYVSSGVPASVQGSFALASAMGFIPDGLGVFPDETVFHRLRYISAENVQWDAVQVRAAADYDVEDFYEVPYSTPIAGLYATSEAASPVAAWGFRTNLVRLDIGRGFKRFVGIPEVAMGDGGILTNDAIASGVELAERMSDVLTYDDEGNTITFSPCVVSKLEYVAPSGKRAYKYYSTLALQLTHVALGIQWSVYNQMRTQRSRQYGHGA